MSTMCNKVISGSYYPTTLAACALGILSLKAKQTIGPEETDPQVNHLPCKSDDP